MASALYILLMGVQGSGKGTQAGELVKKYGIPQVTTGGMFRAMKGQNTPLAREIQATMERGDLVSDELTNQAVRERLAQPDAAKGTILDGYPRTRPQAEALDKMLKERGGKVTIVPFFKLERAIAIQRIAGRRICSKDSSHDFNIYTKPPRVEGICDICGGALIQRADDNPEAAAKRIDLYYQNTMPLLDYYRAKGVLAEINADQSVEKVTADLMAAVDAAIKKG